MAFAVLRGFEKQAYALLRVVFGALFACHGVQKVLGMFGGVGGNGQPAELLSLTGLAGIIELVGGIMIAVGFFAGYAAFIASGEMAVAFFTVHFPQGVLPIQNRGELAVLYCFAFLFIAARGPGIWSVNQK